jgi:hypothetical protein
MLGKFFWFGLSLLASVEDAEGAGNGLGFAPGTVGSESLPVNEAWAKGCDWSEDAAFNLL